MIENDALAITIADQLNDLGGGHRDRAINGHLRFETSSRVNLRCRWFFRLSSSTRGPDVAFISRDRLPAGVFPRQPYPELAPNLVVEVLSPGYTKSEMTRKRLEYVHAGVEIIWIVDCVHRSVAVYTSMTEVVVLGEQDTITGGAVLPQFRVAVADFFTDLDIGRDQPANS